MPENTETENTPALRGCDSGELVVRNGRFNYVVCDKIAQWSAAMPLLPAGKMNYCHKHGLEAQNMGVDVVFDAPELVR